MRAEWVRRLKQLNPVGIVVIRKAIAMILHSLAFPVNPSFDPGPERSCWLRAGQFRTTGFECRRSLSIQLRAILPLLLC
jgi:hypothetical protein